MLDLMCGPASHVASGQQAYVTGMLSLLQMEPAAEQGWLKAGDQLPVDTAPSWDGLFPTDGMVQTGLQRSNQVKSGQAKWLSARTGPQGVFLCGAKRCGRLRSCWQRIFSSLQDKYSPAGTLGSQRAAGDGGGQVPCRLTPPWVALAACNS